MAAVPFDFDLFVVGGGSGGVRAARIAAGHGAKVAICEEYRYGGTCVIRGCVPKKLFVYAAHFHEHYADAGAYGWRHAQAAFDWPTLLANKDREIARLEAIYQRLLDGAGVTRLAGRGRILDPHTVVVEGTQFRARHILLATGGRPVKPGIEGAEYAITSNEAFHLEQLPRHVVVVGGGYIAVEFAGIFNGLGAQVAQLYRGPQILRGFDDDIRHHLAGEIMKKGIDLRTETDPERIERREGGLRVHLKGGGHIDTDLVMMATGRAPNSRDIGLQQVGVTLNDKGAVIVDENACSNIPSIFAVGDVTDRINLTPVAIMEGHSLADRLFAGSDKRPDYDNVPSAVFSQPAVATVGLSEAEARARGMVLDIYKTSFKPLLHTLTGKDEQIFMKLVVDQDSQKVRGVHMVGEDAAELIQGLAVAIKCGATKAQFDATVGIHPTAGEEFVTMREKFVAD